MEKNFAGITFNFAAAAKNFTKSTFLKDDDFEKKFYRLIANADIITHAGPFHADDVFSTALIFLIRDLNMMYAKELDSDCYKYVKVDPIRVFHGVHRISEDLDETSYDTMLCLDVRNGHFDHHHVNTDDRAWYQEGGHPMATIGALWDCVGHMFNIDTHGKNLVGFNVKKKVYKDFLEKIDLADLYGPKTVESPVSKIISNVNAYDVCDFDFVSIDDYPFDSPAEKQNVRFAEAVCLAYKLLRAEIIRAQNFMRSIVGVSENEYVELKTSNLGVNYLLINKVPEGVKEPTVPMEVLDYINVNGKPVDLLVNLNPSIRDGSFRAVAANSAKVPFDKESCSNIENVKGLKFYHPQNFMATFDSAENLETFIRGLYYITGKGLKYSGYYVK
jgi:uncharacterized UPF0160 family protein